MAVAVTLFSSNVSLSSESSLFLKLVEATIIVDFVLVSFFLDAIPTFFKSGLSKLPLNVLLVSPSQTNKLMTICSGV